MQLLEAEDLAEQENKELASRLESLESIVRMLELKHKNSVEHASRLEEREADLKKVKQPAINQLLTFANFHLELTHTLPHIGICQAARTLHRTVQEPCGLHGTHQNADGLDALTNEQCLRSHGGESGAT